MIYKNTEKSTPIIGDLVRISDSAGSYNERYSTIGNMLEVANYATKTTDYTILDTDYSGERFIGNPNSSSAQWGLLTFTLPTIADNIGKWYEVEHGANQGLIKIASESSDGLYFRQQTKSSVLLYSPGSVYNNGSKWVVTGSNLFDTSWCNRTDWTNVHIGNGVTYDTKSAAVDLTGRVITESTSNFSAVIVEDTGNTSSTGILYIYELSSGFTFWTNNRTLTASGGKTCLVNETTGGTSLNIDYNLDHEFGSYQSKFRTRLFWSSDGTDANEVEVNANYDSGGTSPNRGYNNYNVSANAIKIQTGTAEAFGIVADDGTINIIDTEDDYIKIILDFSA
jgi:hypothetical protein